MKSSDARCPIPRLMLLVPEHGPVEEVVAGAVQRPCNPGLCGWNLCPSVPRRYLELYNRIDIGVDPIPYNGHTTTCDSIWMGVPVVSLNGRTSVGCCGGVSLLRQPRPRAPDRPDAQRSTCRSRPVRPPSSGNCAACAVRGPSGARRMEASPLMDAPAYTRGWRGCLVKCGRLWCASVRTLIDGDGKFRTGPNPNIPDG